MSLVVQWMWGDAKVFSHTIAQKNPLRWSERKTVTCTVTDFRSFGPEEGRRPLDVKVQRFNHSSDKYITLLSQKFQNAAEAIPRLITFESEYHHGTTTESLGGNNSFEVQADIASEPRACAENRQLAGMLEKKSRWRKEWEMRFFIMRQDRIDYYMNPPEPDIITEEDGSTRKGFIPLASPVFADDENKPYCIGVGESMISCATREEQLKWLETIKAAASRLKSQETVKAATQVSKATRSIPEISEAAQLSGLKACRLMLAPPETENAPKSMKWRECEDVLIPSSKATVPVLLVDGCLRAICRLSLFDLQANQTRSFPITLQSEIDSSSGGQTSSSPFRLCVKGSSNILQASRATDYTMFVVSLCVIAMALLLAQNTQLSLGRHCSALVVLVILVVIAALSVFQGSRLADPPQRKVKFSVECVEMETASIAASPATSPSATPSLTPTLAPTRTQRWVGKWVLDQSCSEKYEPIMADLGVNWVLRKAADSAASSMDISTTASHVTIIAKVYITLEDCIPLDGSWKSKPVPKGSKMKGNCNIRVVKHNDNELQLYTDFGGENGDLTDTLTMNDDGKSFKRVVSRGDLQVTRIFRRE